MNSAELDWVVLFHMTSTGMTWWYSTGGFIHNAWCPVQDSWRFISTGHLSLSVESQGFSAWPLSRVLRPLQGISVLRKSRWEASVLSLVGPRTDLASLPPYFISRRGTSQPRFKYRGDMYQHLIKEMPKNLKPSLISHKHLIKMARVIYSNSDHLLFHTAHSTPSILSLGWLFYTLWC